jgi:hypothetical protein
VLRWNEWKQPQQDLPIAPDPPVLPTRVREHAGGVVVDELHVRHERDTRVEAFEQVVGEQRVLRHQTLERGGEGVHVVETLAGEDAFPEKVLVGVGYRSGVGVDAGVPSVEPREQRSGRAQERDTHPRLEDAVTFRHATHPWIEFGLVQRMRDDANELPRDVARQASITVECDAVPHGRQHREVADVDRETGIGRTTQQAVELLDFAALALPSHPEAFARIPLTQTMEQEKTI